jgi:hypothetical protein
MKLLRLFGVVLCLGLLTAEVSAAAESKIYEKITAADFRRMLTASGFGGETDKDGDVVTKMEGQSVLVLIGSNEGTVIQFRFSIKATATLRQVNDWNRMRKYGKAYLDDDGDPTLDMDVDLEGGITEARIKDSISTFKLLLESFLKHLKESK